VNRIVFVATAASRLVLRAAGSLINCPPVIEPAFAWRAPVLVMPVIMQQNRAGWLAYVGATETANLRPQRHRRDQANAGQGQELGNDRIACGYCCLDLRFDRHDTGRQIDDLFLVVLRDPAVALAERGFVLQPGQPGLRPGPGLAAPPSVLPQQNANPQLHIFAAADQLRTVSNQAPQNPVKRGASHAFVN
jgi:hypothetical protein